MNLFFALLHDLSFVSPAGSRYHSATASYGEQTFSDTPQRVCGSPAPAEPAVSVDEELAEVQLLAARGPAARIPAVRAAQPQGGSGDHHAVLQAPSGAPRGVADQQEAGALLQDEAEFLLADAAALQQLMVKLQRLHGAAAAAQDAGRQQDFAAVRGHDAPRSAD